MTTSELAELLLARLYDRTRATHHGCMFPLVEIAAELGEHDLLRVYGIAQMLEDRGLIDRRRTISREANAAITVDGEMFVEAGGETAVIPVYREHPDRFVVHVDRSTHFHGSVFNSNVAVNSPAVTQKSFDPRVTNLLDGIERVLKSDNTIPHHTRHEALADVELVRAELARSEPRPGVFRAILATLGDIASVASLAGQLGSVLLER